MSDDPFRKAQDEYFKLRGQLDAKKLSREDFEAALHQCACRMRKGATGCPARRQAIGIITMGPNGCPDSHPEAPQLSELPQAQPEPAPRKRRTLPRHKRKAAEETLEKSSPYSSARLLCWHSSSADTCLPRTRGCSRDKRTPQTPPSRQSCH